MTAPAIRAALDAAAEASRNWMCASATCTSDVCDGGPCACARDAATAAVAAFLRALPDRVVVQLMEPACDTLHSLAAAVEAAAEGGAGE